MPDRAPGVYLVREKLGPSWRLAFWMPPETLPPGGWLRFGDATLRDDSFFAEIGRLIDLADFAEIGPRVESPEEMGAEWLPALSPVRHNEQITTVQDRPVILYSDHTGNRWCVCIDDGPVIALGRHDETSARREAALIARSQRPEVLAEARLSRMDVHAREEDLRRLRSSLRAAEDEAASLRARLEHALGEVRALRAKVGGTVKQAGAPRENDS